MAALTPGYDPVAKVTIVPRSNGAGGFTLFTPSEDRMDGGMYSYRYLVAQLAVALGGRVAEEMAFGSDDVTTGALAASRCRVHLTMPGVVSFSILSAPRRRVERPPAGPVHRAAHGRPVGLHGHRRKALWRDSTSSRRLGVARKEHGVADDGLEGP